MVRKIGKDGRVWRLTKEVWDLLLPLDSDPNAAILKLNAMTKNYAQTDKCRFDTDKLKSTIKEAMDSALEPFIGK
jgi:hypothetical protein